jgi:hypothetical protein
MIPDAVVQQIEHKYDALSPLLNERSRRLWAATKTSNSKFKIFRGWNP